jgi:hypothetical protein
VRGVGNLLKAVHVVDTDKRFSEFCMNEVYPFIDKTGLGDIWASKPLLNGLELVELIGITPGPEPKKRMKELIDWQINHPIGTADDYKAFLHG